MFTLRFVVMIMRKGKTATGTKSRSERPLVVLSVLGLSSHDYRGMPLIVYFIILLRGRVGEQQC